MVIAVALELVACQRSRADQAEARGAATSTSNSTSAVPVPLANDPVVTLTDLPPPATRVPEAGREYANGMRLYKADNWPEARNHFERAAQLDPSMAAAFMRVSMMSMGRENSDMREFFDLALAHRAALVARDQSLLEALEPVLHRAQPDRIEAWYRIESLIPVYPTDVEFQDWSIDLEVTAPRLLAASDRAIGLDPQDGNAWDGRGRALEQLGRLEEARAAFQRCAALSVESVDCLYYQAVDDMALGRCEDYGRELNGAAERSPWYRAQQVGAMVAMGQPDRAIRSRISEIAHRAGPAGAVGELLGEMRLADIAGDFDQSRNLLAKTRVLLATGPGHRPSLETNLEIALRLMNEALETGDRSGARAIAREFGEAAPTSDTNPARGVGLSLVVARIADPPGPGSHFESTRQNWLDAHTTYEIPPGMLWTYGYAAVALTPEEANAALAVLPKYVPISPIYRGAEGLNDGYVGRTYLLAGRVDEALPFLRRAALSCTLWSSTFDLMHARRDLGLALEQRDDHVGACTAYAKVIKQWGNAKPRSVTVEEAQWRRRFLDCPQ